jgi:branched-chain amino acid transport system substrate-binding protein
MNRTAAFLSVLAVLFSLALWQGAPPAVWAETVSIGHPACLTGKYAAPGRQAHAGIKACVAWINEERGGVQVGGRKMELEYVHRDCRSEKERVSRLIGRLMYRHKVDVIFAPYSSELSWRGLPQAESRRFLYMVHGGADDALFEQGFNYVVQTIGPASKYHHGVLEMVQRLDPQATKLALIHEDSDFARRVRAGTEHRAKELGLNIVFNTIYPSGARNLAPLLKPLQQLQPDLILGGGHFKDGLLLSRQLAKLEINPKLLSLIVSASLPGFYKELGPSANGIMGPSHWEFGVAYTPELAKQSGLKWFGPSQEEFVRLFQEAASKEGMPGYHAAEAGAQVLAYVLGVERADSLDPGKVRAALGDLEFMSFYGGWDIDDTGLQVGHSMVAIQWQDGEREIVWPLKARSAKPLYPKPSF